MKEIPADDVMVLETSDRLNDTLSKVETHQYIPTRFVKIINIST